MPDAGITTDMITGFPGETEEDFNESYEFAKKMKLSKIHVFPFSPKKGTAAAGFPNQVGGNKKRERTEMLLKLSDMTGAEYLNGFTGKILNVLYETEKSGVYTGYSTNYITVSTKSNQNLINVIKPVKIAEIKGLTAVSE